MTEEEPHTSSTTTVTARDHLYTTLKNTPVSSTPKGLRKRKNEESVSVGDQLLALTKERDIKTAEYKAKKLKLMETFYSKNLELMEKDIKIKIEALNVLREINNKINV